MQFQLIFLKIKKIRGGPMVWVFGRYVGLAQKPINF